MIHQLVRFVDHLSAFRAVCIAVLFSAVHLGGPHWLDAQECEPIPRQVPPIGLEIPSQKQVEWESQIDKLDTALESVEDDLVDDIHVLIKACRYAIQFRELYQEKDFSKVDQLLKLAQQRLQDLGDGRARWQLEAGRQVRGFRSAVDDSVQPLGVILPENWTTSKTRLPLYVWLHGRGDKTTDIHFITERLAKDGQILPENAIVLHPFGRQCIGYKSAGETDVMEAINFACANYPVDENRIVLMGFSMGGAGVWHLAAHYGERFVAASSGAGFAETARYQKLTPEQFPPEYVQILWKVYDVPGYTQNLFNLPFVAYSGELDKQIQAAQVMEEAFRSEGRQLTHLIGPGMGHKYHPDTLQEIMEAMDAAVRAGKNPSPVEFWIQSPHPRYASRMWLTIDGAIESYGDTRASARRLQNRWEVSTRNASRLQIDLSHPQAPVQQLVVDGEVVNLPEQGTVWLVREENRWEVAEELPKLRKHSKLSGPIDDAFIDPFLIVLPTGEFWHPEVEKWVQCELSNLNDRWESLFRGKLRTKYDRDVTEQDLSLYHVVVWGDPSSNLLLKRAMQVRGGSLPIQWDQQSLTMGGGTHRSNSHVPVGIYPNPLNPDRYMVLNSGPTFRQAHDRTNSLQNPHLPDWAVLGLDQPANAESAGKVLEAGFFSDSWEFDSAMTFIPE